MTRRSTSQGRLRGGLSRIARDLGPGATLRGLLYALAGGTVGALIGLLFTATTAR
ncbi:hypothetical protein [Streptomyces cinereoruber]|uniref:hypothetical protein n=1 Tax=Streptomyces cinereoruber TaxID=67260 RepID=UPI003648CA24